SGRYLWNGGIFVFRADAILAALRLHMPELAPGLDAIAEVLGTRKEAATLARVFRRFPSISIDYGVMEKADNLAVVGGDFGWSDVGSFAALPEVRSADAQGNVVSGRGAVVLDSEGCVVHAEKRPIAVVGMKDTVVVDTGDTLLVVPKDRAQEVRKAVDAFKARRLTRYLCARRWDRGDGHLAPGAPDGPVPAAGRAPREMPTSSCACLPARRGAGKFSLIPFCPASASLPSTGQGSARP